MIERHLPAIIKSFAPGAMIVATEPLTGGVSADVYRIDLQLDDRSSEQLVLRVHGQHHSGLPAELEFELLQALHTAGVPVAEPVCMNDTRDILEYPYLVIRFVEGSTEIPEAGIGQRLDKMAGMLASIHQLDISDLPLLPDRTDPLPELFDFLPARDDPRNIRKHLASLTGTAYDDRPVLLHGDFWPENLLWQDEAIAAVLDWEDAALGDPMSDLAGAMLEVTYHFGSGRAAEFKEAYATHLPVNSERLLLWQVYVGSAALKYMGGWRLPPDLESHMRGVATASVEAAGQRLMAL